MEDRKFVIYYFLSMVMIIFPIINLLSFVPMVILYKKSNFRIYLLSVAMYSIFALMILGSFTAFIPVIISFIMIKGLDNGVYGYKIMIGSAVAMAMLLVSDFILLELNANSYETFVKYLGEFLENFKSYKEVLSITSVESFVEAMKKIYPAISFGMSYVFCALGYSFLSKKIYKLNRDSDDYVVAYSSKYLTFITIISIVIFIASIFDFEGKYQVFLTIYNIMMMFVEIMVIQGFIKFNTFLKSRNSTFLSNLITFISIFFTFLYLLYFIYGIVCTIRRGVKWERK